jgi:hypothetical protein
MGVIWEEMVISDLFSGHETKKYFSMPKDPVATLATWVEIVALAPYAKAANVTQSRLAATCTKSYRLKYRGPVSEITLDGGNTIELYGFDYLCGNRLGNAIPNSVYRLYLIAKVTPVWMWVERLEVPR